MKISYKVVALVFAILFVISLLFSIIQYYKPSQQAIDLNNCVHNYVVAKAETAQAVYTMTTCQRVIDTKANCN